MTAQPEERKLTMSPSRQGEYAVRKCSGAVGQDAVMYFTRSPIVVEAATRGMRRRSIGSPGGRVGRCAAGWVRPRQARDAEVTAVPPRRARRGESDSGVHLP
jgi:hypothetical protein